MGNTFYTPEKWLSSRVEVHLIGAGGTGSEVFDGLLRLHKALIALGHPGGLRVTVFDPDTVSESNTIRQRFWPSDIGQNKAELLVHRANVYAGLDWKAVPDYHSPEPKTSGFNRFYAEPDLLIGCVDSAKWRTEYALYSRDQYSKTIWLDCGNDSTSAQVVMGHAGTPQGQRLPNVFDLYPSLTEAVDDDTPSCSAAEALRSQDLFVNRFVADYAVNLIYRLLRDGQIGIHGGFVDVLSGHATPIPIDPKTWACFGYQVECEDA